MKHGWWLYLLLACITPASLAVAQPLDIQLVSSVQTVQPGQDFYLALQLRHGHGYHTYWRHPGVVGVATQVHEWIRLPEGVRVDPISWPQPEHVKMYQTDAQGYERDVLLPMRVHVSEKLQPEQTLNFQAKTVWMCCNRECNPGLAVLQLQLRVSTAPPAPSTWANSIQQELNAQPQTSQHWQVSGSRDKKQVQLVLKPYGTANPFHTSELMGLRFFTLDGVVDSSKAQSFTLSSEGHLQVLLQLMEDVHGGQVTQLKGVILRKTDWQRDKSFQALELQAHLKNSKR